MSDLACPTCHRPYARIPVQQYPRPTEEELIALAPSGSRWRYNRRPDAKIAVSLGIDPNWRDPREWHEDYVPEPQLLFRTGEGYMADVFSVPCTYVREGGCYTRVEEVLDAAS